jgi:hypothetical protein
MAVRFISIMMTYQFLQSCILNILKILDTYVVNIYLNTGNPKSISKNNLYLPLSMSTYKYKSAATQSIYIIAKVCLSICPINSSKQCIVGKINRDNNVPLEQSHAEIVNFAATCINSSLSQIIYPLLPL